MVRFPDPQNPHQYSATHRDTFILGILLPPVYCSELLMEVLVAKWSLIFESFDRIIFQLRFCYYATSKRFDFLKNLILVNSP